MSNLLARIKTWLAAARASHRTAAVHDYIEQNALAIDQQLNTAVVGLATLIAVLVTGRPRPACFADETMSAHAYRAAARGRLWGRTLRPAIDVLFFWQPQDEDVNAFAGHPVPGHCERAYYKEALRRNLPLDYHKYTAAAPTQQTP